MLPTQSSLQILDLLRDLSRGRQQSSKSSSPSSSSSSSNSQASGKQGSSQRESRSSELRSYQSVFLVDIDPFLYSRLHHALSVLRLTPALPADITAYTAEVLMMRSVGIAAHT